MKLSRVEKTLYVIVVLFFILFTLGPLIWAFIISITPEPEITQFNTNLIPKNPYWQNYQELFDPDSSAFDTVFPALWNTVKMSFLSILIGLPIATMTAYAFYRYRFKGNRLIFLFIIITIVIPVFTTIIPIYAMFARNGLLDNMFWVSIIYISAFLPLNTWLIYVYFQSIPYEVIEAAMMDGADEVKVFFETVLPLSWPILVTGVLIIFLMAWSQFQIPMILTSSQNTKVITLVLQEFQGRYAVSYGLIAASGILTIIPPTIVAVFFRRFLVSGLTGGATKE